MGSFLRDCALGAAICLIAGGSSHSGLVQHSAPEALRGLDPVLLARGESRPGREEFSIIHHGYWYRFVSAESRDEFRRNPAAFEVRLGGVCARMGGLTPGDPEIFAVHQRRIYLFSSEDCRQRFRSTPDLYLPPVENPAAPTPAAVARARDALELAASRMGAVGDLRGYGLRSAYRHRAPQGQVLMEAEVLLRFDGYFRRVEKRTFGPLAMVLAPGEGFTETAGRRRSLNPGQRAYLDSLRRRQLPALLWARLAPDLEAFMIEEGAIEVQWGRTRSRLGLDRWGDVETLSYQGRGVEGVFGLVVERFLDYRSVAGFRLPHRVEATWDGLPDVGRSLEIGEWRLSPPSVEEFIKPLASSLRSGQPPARSGD